ncbi:MAG: multicopper oxidase domain-containing protein, partial [Gemmatimonadota bacterium]
ENGSGGWWHPLHTHLEGFQIKKVDGELPRRERRFNSDLVQLEGGFVAELLIKFRTFTGPFAFHCHNIEHEDMRMMGAHDPTPVEGDPLADLDAIDATPPMDGVTEIDPAVSGVVLTCEQLELQKRLFFDEAGDLDRLEGRGVGIGECEFELDGG